MDIEAALNAGHCVEFAREIQSATAPIGVVASNDSNNVPFMPLAGRALPFVDRLALSACSPAIASERRRRDREVVNRSVRFALRQGMAPGIV